MDLNHYTILFVEDEDDIRENYAFFLRARLGCNVIEAKDGQEALNVFFQKKCDIILTDISMPNIDGLALAKAIRKEKVGIPIVFLTAYSDNDKLLEALQLQTTSYLLKPVSREKIMQALQKAIEIIKIQKTHNENCLWITKTAIYCFEEKEYRLNGKIVKLTEYEGKLLHFLCINKNIQLSSIDIFSEVWRDSDQEFKPDLIRTLIKKIRKKLPEGSLENIYGGYYRLRIQK